MTAYFVTNPREVANLAAIRVLSEAVFAILVDLNARSIIQHNRREQ